jgi:hypothetical protein
MIMIINGDDWDLLICLKARTSERCKLMSQRPGEDAEILTRNYLLKLCPRESHVDKCFVVGLLKFFFFLEVKSILDRLCGLVVRVPGFRSRNPGFDSRAYQIFWEIVGLERGSLSLMNVTEELLEWISSGFGSRKTRLTALGIRCAEHATHSTRKSWH